MRTIVAALMWFAGLGTSAVAADDRPNIVYFVSDELG